MGKKVWIMNHYATNMFVDKAGRHYWFAKELKEHGYDVTVFCATTFLNRDDVIDTNGKKFIEDQTEGIPFVFVSTIPAQGNGIRRVKSWLLFYKNLFPATRNRTLKNGKPDVIIASSVHPLTMVAGIRIAKRLKIPCICEVRDLWPEAIFQFGKSREMSLMGRILIKGEYWIYKNAKALIFTKEGDTDYLKEKKWTTAQGGDIDLKKCYYINNGIDLKDYEERMQTIQLDDPDLNNDTTFIEDFLQDVEQEIISYPVFVKPVRGSASIAISKVYDQETLELLFRHTDTPLIIQEFLNGQEIGADCYIDLISGENVSIFTKKKLLMRAGETDKAVSFKDPKLFQLIEKFIREFGFRGPIDIDIFDIDGTYYISEVNPRFGGGYPHAYECGVNHMKMIMKNLEGKKNDMKIGEYEEGIYMMKFNKVLVKA